MHLAHVSAVCSTSQNADRFYSGLLGLKKVKEFTLNAELIDQIFDKEISCKIILYSSDRFTIEVFIQADGLTPANPFIHHCLKVEDKDNFLNRCKNDGLEVSYIPKGDKTLSFIRDYDGNIYEIT